MGSIEEEVELQETNSDGQNSHNSEVHRTNSGNIDSNNTQTSTSAQMEDKDSTDKNVEKENLEVDGVASESQPLKGDAKDGDVEIDGNFRGARYLHEKKAKQRRCMYVGAGLLITIVIAAIISIIVHRFTGKHATFSYASYYSSKMVLQRAPHKAAIWGLGPQGGKNETVEVTIEGAGISKTFTTVVLDTANGAIWKVYLDPVSEPGPFQITAKLKGYSTNELVLEDVLFGDVWLCAGESNMQLTLDMLKNGSAEMEDAMKYPNIRMFAPSPSKASRPWNDLSRVMLPWSLPTNPGSLKGPALYGSQMASYFSATCWLFGKKLHQEIGVPIGLISATYSNSFIEEWVSQDVIDKCPRELAHNKRASMKSSLWNAMIHPLLDMTLYGVIWHQGESDALDFSRSYNCTFPRMINDWRKNFAQTSRMNLTIPFGFVQLAPNREGAHLLYGWTDTRWQQTADFGFVPNPWMQKVFMAVTTDLPDMDSPYESIHSRHKHEVAERLGLGALNVAYGKEDVVYQGPVPIMYTADPNTKILKLQYENTPLVVKNNTGFEVCCSTNRTLFCPTSNMKSIFAPGREWNPAPITTHTEDTVDLDWSLCQDKHVVGLRYTWRETPCALHGCPLYGATNSLPAPPYIRFGFIDDGVRYPLTKSQYHLL